MSSGPEAHARLILAIPGAGGAILMNEDASNQSGHSAGGRGGREWDGTRRADPAAAKERHSAIARVSSGTRTHTDRVRGASR